MKIGSALVLVLMLVFLVPKAKQMVTASPAAEPGDWQSVLLPLLAVVLFVICLVSLASS